MFEINKIFIGKIYTTVDSCFISSDSFCDEYEVIYEPIRIAALYNNTENTSLYREYIDISNDKYYMDEYFCTSKHSLFVDNNQKFMPLTLYLNEIGISYNKKTISKEELNLLLSDTFNKYNDKYFNYGRKLLQRDKMIIRNIKKTILILKDFPDKLESTIELLYEKGLKIDQFKILSNSNNMCSNLLNINNNQRIIAMVLKGDDALRKLNKASIISNNYAYIPQNIDEIKEEYNKLFNQKQKRI